MDQLLTPAAAEPQPIDQSRWLDLGVVLLVAFGMPILSSTHIVLRGASNADPQKLPIRILASMLSEITALLVLWYVLNRQGRNWRDIAGGFSATDIPKGIGLFVGGYLASIVLILPVQYAHWFFYGHYLVPRNVGAMLGLELSALPLVFVCINPFFEELVVRAYAMSELMYLGRGPWLAALISVGLQVSYHLYQGLANVLGVAIVFSIFAAYFARSRRVMPIVLAHFLFDFTALLLHRV